MCTVLNQVSGEAQSHLLGACSPHGVTTNCTITSEHVTDHTIITPHYEGYFMCKLAYKGQILLYKSPCAAYKIWCSCMNIQ